MIRPERRTRADLIAALAIIVVVAVAAALIWWTSDARATISRPATTPAPNTAPARALPAALNQLWTAPSPKTDTPVVVSGTVVTGDGRELVGRDPKTGGQRWLFGRDRELCGVTWSYDLAVAVYPDGRGCGQVSTVDGATGRRGPTRTGYADKQVTLASDGITVLAWGSTRVEMWRSDMVRTLAWGPLDAPINPPVQPQPPCTFVSVAASSDAASILEACPNAPDLRLTMLKVAKEDVSPEQRYAEQTGADAKSGAKVLMVSGQRTAVYLPAPQPRIVVYDETGVEISSTALAKPAPPAITASRAGDLVTVWTGDSVVVLDGSSLTYRYAIAAGAATPIGPGAMMADRLLIPLSTGMGVYDPMTGAPDRVIPADRGGVQPPVLPGLAGTTVVEQRGDTIVALGDRG
jgi:predicted metal-binding membrane protein